MTAPTIYDISTDEMRPVTQQDVDELVAIRDIYLAMRRKRRKLFGLRPPARPRTAGVIVAVRNRLLRRHARAMQMHIVTGRVS